MAKPFEGLPATVLQTPDILGQGLQDVFRAKQIEAAQQPKPVEYGGGYKSPDLKEYDPRWEAPIGALKQDIIRPPELYNDPNVPTEWISRVNSEPKSREEFLWQQGVKARMADRADVFNTEAELSKTWASNRDAFEKTISSNDKLNTYYNRQLIKAADQMLTAKAEAAEMGYTPYKDKERGDLVFPMVGDYLLPFLTEEDRAILESQEPTVVDGKTIYKVPARIANQYLTFSKTPKVASSIDKEIQSAKVGSVTTVNETEDETGRYWVTEGGKRYEPSSVGSAVGRIVFSNFERSNLDEDGKIIDYSKVDLSGPAYTYAESLGIADDGISDNDKERIYTNWLQQKKDQLDIRESTTISDKSKGGGAGWMDKSGITPYADYGQPIRNIQVTLDQREGKRVNMPKEGVGISMSPTTVRVGQTKGSREGYMLLTESFSTYEDGKPKVYFRGQFVSSDIVQNVMDEMGYSNVEDAAKDERFNQRINNIMGSEVPTEWFSPNPSVQSNLTAIIGDKVNQSLTFKDIWEAPQKLTGIDLTGGKKKETQTEEEVGESGIKWANPNQ